MFNPEKVHHYSCSHPQILEELRAPCVTQGGCCTPATDVNTTLRTTFKFIKDHPIRVEGKLAEVAITLSAFLLESETPQNNNFNYAVSEIRGVVEEVHDRYAVITYENLQQQSIKCVIAYEGIVSVYHRSIETYFEEYVNAINRTAPLCIDKGNTSLDLLIDISKIIGRNRPDERDFVFILDGVLTRAFEAKSIAIIRNLIVLEEAIVLPITEVGGFLQQ